MGIELDWEVESDSGKTPVAEDAAVIAAGKRRDKFNRTALIVAVIVLIIGASIAAYRAKIVRDEKLRVLKLTVEAEALALRIGDKDEFMRLQGPADDWRTEQRAHFDQMVAQADVLVEGTIIDLKMTNTEARVVIAMEVDGQPSQAVWLYEYLDRGWRHTSTEEEPWTERTDVSGSFIFTYQAIDQASVDHLRGILDGWWALAADQMRTDDLPTVAITLTESVNVIEWDTERANHLLIPPKVFEGGAIQSAPRDRLAALLAEHWSTHVIADGSPLDEESGLMGVHKETALWLEGRFGGQPERLSALTHLTASFGDDLLPSFFALNRDSGDPLDSLRTALRQQAPRQLTTAYFKNYLEATLSMMRGGMHPYMGYYAPTVLPLIDPDVMEGSSPSVGTMLLAGGLPDTVVVDEVRQFGEVYWVLGSFRIDSTLGAPFASDADRTQFIIPFREIDGYYQIAAIRPGDLGEQMTEQSAYVTLTFYEMDLPYFGGSAPEFEQDYLEAAAMFGLTNTPHIGIRVMDDMNEETMLRQSLIAPQIYSPYQICCFPGYDAREFAYLYYIWDLYTQIFNAQAGTAGSGGGVGNPPNPDLENALIVVAAARKGYDVSLFRGGGEISFPPQSVILPASLDSMWIGFDTISADPLAWQLQQLGTRVLIELLVDRYGQQALIPLTQTIRHSGSMEEWLANSIGITVQDIETEWRERLLQEVREHTIQ